MTFRDPILAGNELVREAIHSPDYAAGSAGWSINRDGSAEFNDITLRGTFSTGAAPQPYVAIFDDGTTAVVRLSSGDPTETHPGAIYASADFGAGVYTAVESPETGATYKQAFVKILSENATHTASVELSSAGPNLLGPLKLKVFGNAELDQVSGAGGNLTTGGTITSAGDIKGTGAIGVTADGGEFVASKTATDSLTAHLNRNQLYALNGAVASTLFLNYNGGPIQLGNGGQVNAGGPLGVNGILTNSFGAQLDGNFTAASGSALGTALIVSGGQMNAAVSPPTTATAANATWINTSGTNWRLNRFTSSRRYKENIRDLEVPAASILALRPRTFQRNDHRDWSAEDEDGNAPVLPVTEATPWSVGFIAEEADELGLSAWVERDSDGEIEGFSYATFVAAQQVVMREQQRLIEELSARVSELEKR